MIFRPRTLRYVGTAIAALGVSGTAFAIPRIHQNSSAPWLRPPSVFMNHFPPIPAPGPVKQDPPGPISAPEIDPTSALGALTLLAGGLAVIRGRRTKD